MPRPNRMPLKADAGISVGVGIDLLNLSRVKRLFRHPKKKSLKNLFTPSERKTLSGTQLAIRAARLLAAKEAFFKASSSVWMGPGGFKDIEVRCFPGSRFQVKSLRTSSSGEGTFFEKDQLVGAQVIVWA